MMPMAKLWLLLPLGFAVMLIGHILEIEALLIASFAFVAGNFLAIWAIQGGRDRCDGRMHWRTSESGEVIIGICDSCRRWSIVIRGTRIAKGEGLAQFLEVAAEVAQRYDRVVPQISGELRSVIRRLDEPKADDGQASLEQQQA